MQFSYIIGNFTSGYSSIKVSAGGFVVLDSTADGASTTTVQVVGGVWQIINSAINGGTATTLLDTSNANLSTTTHGVGIAWTGETPAVSFTGGDLNDMVIGGNGNDTLYGGLGVDTIYGGTGDDALHAGSDRNRLAGNDGLDTLYGGDGADTLYGNAGNDLLYGNEGADSLYGNAGNDTIYGGDGADSILGQTEDDSIEGGLGNDRVIGNEGNDTLYGNEGADTIFGNAGSDSLWGGDDNDVLTGDTGDDTLMGGGGADSLSGGTENDSLVGGDGDDTLTGGTGTDMLDGGAGSDVFLDPDGDTITTLEADDIIRLTGGGGQSFTTSHLQYDSGTKTLTVDFDKNSTFGGGTDKVIVFTNAPASSSFEISDNTTFADIKLRPGPTVTDANIAISGGSGTAGAYKIGDTVTATWNNTAGGDNNTVTITTVTMDFSAFGGGATVTATNSSNTWTATYTLVAGAIEATNRNVSVTATDNASTATTRADSTNATVDNVAPGTPSTVIDLATASDSGTSNTDDRTSTANPTVRISLTGTSAVAGDALQLLLGGVAFGTPVTRTLDGDDITNGYYDFTLSGSPLGADGAKVLTARVVDAAGNIGAEGGTLTVTLDISAPTLDGANSTPADNGTIQALGSNIVIDFSENIAFGSSGNIITLRNLTTPGSVETFNVGVGSATGTATIAGDKLTLSPHTDLLQGNAYSVQFGSTSLVDTAGNSLDAISNDTTYNFTTVPANTAPTLTSGTTGSVAENAATSTVVYTATAIDIDAGTTLTYSLSGTDAASFDIVSSTGVVTLKASADFETKASYSFTVVATDNGTGNLSDTKAVSLAITNQDEGAPTITPVITLTNPDGTITVVSVTPGANTIIAAPAAGSTVVANASGDTTVTNPGTTVTLNNTGSGTVTTSGITASTTLTIIGSGTQKVDITGMQPGQVLTIDNTGSGTVDLSNLPDGVIVKLPGSGPVSLNDNDGATAGVENTVPALTGGVVGDGNGDGTPDALQSNVASVAFLKTETAQSSPSNAPTAFVSLIADAKGGKVDTTNTITASLSNVRQLDAPADLPAEIKMPLGLIAFSANVGLNTPSTPAAVVTTAFSLYVDPSLGVNGYWKQDASKTWVNLASAAYGGQIVTEGGKIRLDFQLTDGGQFDADGKVDGVITDPGAAANIPLSLVSYAPTLADGTHFWF